LNSSPTQFNEDGFDDVQSLCILCIIGLGLVLFFHLLH